MTLKKMLLPEQAYKGCTVPGDESLRILVLLASLSQELDRRFHRPHTPNLRTD